LTVIFCKAAFSQSKPLQDTAHAFEYDQKASLDIKEISVEDHDGIKVHDISYASPKSGRVTAYLVVPSSKGSFAGIVYAHWALGNRAEFLPEALLLARAGAVSLLIDEPFVRPASWRAPPPGHFTQPEGDRDLFIQTVVDLRRGVDVLLSQPNVDAKRLAYVGHSYSATWGGTLAGVERRIKAYVLMAGDPSVTDFSGEDDEAVAIRNSFTPKQIENYVQIISPLNPINYIGHAAPSALFFQFARHDKYTSKQAELRYAQAASEPKIIKWYETGHELNSIEALRDRAEWLRAQIKIDPLAPILLEKLSVKGVR
jgi:dienelactone hydrolase